MWGRLGKPGLMTLGNQSSSELQMGSSRNRSPPSPRRDEDPSWDSEDPPKPRRKPPRTYSVLFIINRGGTELKLSINSFS